MKPVHLIAAVVAVACVATPAMAVVPPTWVGTASYGAGAETVGPFNTYDFASAGVLLVDPTSGTTANGYYQSFVNQHLLDGLLVSNPLLSAGNYEITVTANFSSVLTSANLFGQTFNVNSGSFALWLDTTPDRNFATDTGFSNGVMIMQGNVVAGASSTVNIGIQQFGGASLGLAVTGYDPTVFAPATIGGGESIFTLRLNAAVDNAFVNPITSVQTVLYLPGTGDLRYVADGNLILTAVPEPGSWAMILAGLGLIGTMVRRRS